MKKAFFILAAILLAGTISAQNYKKNIIGFRAGLNLSKLSVSGGDASISSNSRAGYHFSIRDQILLCNKFPLYLETGIGISSRGGKEGNATISPLYLQIPVLVNYHFDIKKIISIQPFAGFYYGFGIAGKAKDYDGQEQAIFGEGGMLRRSDMGIRFGIGIVRNYFYFGVGYDIGCMSLTESTDITVHNNCFTLSAGFNF